MSEIKFYAKVPSRNGNGKGKRKSFSIFQRTVNPDGSTKNKVVLSNALTAINKQYEAGTIPFETAHRNVKKVIENLYKDIGIRKTPSVFNNDNQRILESYWSDEYSHRILQDPDSALGDLTRAVEALGNVSILSGTQSEIQAAINQFKGNKQRKIVGRINQLLQYVKRSHEIRLKMARPVRPKVKYLSEIELEQVLSNIDSKALRELCRVCFYTGTRLGEAFALNSNSLRGNKKTIYIETQLDEDDEERSPKWDSVRAVYVIPRGVGAIGNWIELKDGLELSRCSLRKKLRIACQKAFAGKPEKYCSFKELRHSYAIYLLGKGVSLSLIAQSLGNSLNVCQRHYAGFELNPDSVEAIDSIVRKKTVSK